MSQLFEKETISEYVKSLRDFLGQNTRDRKTVLYVDLLYAYNLILNNKSLQEAKRTLEEILSTRLIQKNQGWVFIYNRALALLGLNYFKQNQLLLSKEMLWDLFNKPNPTLQLG